MNLVRGVMDAGHSVEEAINAAEGHDMGGEPTNRLGVASSADPAEYLEGKKVGLGFRETRGKTESALSALQRGAPRAFELGDFMLLAAPAH
jgi:hypothetical protein